MSDGFVCPADGDPCREDCPAVTDCERTAATCPSCGAKQGSTRVVAGRCIHCAD